MPSQALDWGRALTLSERDLLLSSAEPAGNGDGDSQGFDPELARQRLERWRAESALDDEGRFQRKLEQLGLSAERLAQILGSPAPGLIDRGPSDRPEWLARVVEAYRKPRPGPFGGMPTPVAEKQPDGLFLDILRPLLDDAWTRLHNALERLPETDDRPAHQR
ncbi:MAG: hypothetical protein AAF725_23090, partial [Acidobacteriota bacterium]